jgi:hemerythrin-like domain-containing protein
MLYETAIKLQRTDFNNEEEAKAIIQNITSMVDLFDKHAYVEDTLVFPAEKNAPEPVFNNLFTAAEKELPNPRFRKILEGLTEGVMLA